METLEIYETYEIYENLFVSSFSAAKQCPFINDAFIVNCTVDLPMIHKNGIRVPVDDDEYQGSNDKLLLLLPGIVTMIDEQLCKNKKVIVHCLAGQQRSPAVVCAYIIWKYKHTSLHQAIYRVRAIKKDAFFWTVHFRNALERYEVSLRGKNIKTIETSGLMRPPLPSRAYLV